MQNSCTQASALTLILFLRLRHPKDISPASSSSFDYTGNTDYDLEDGSASNYQPGCTSDSSKTSTSGKPSIASIYCGQGIDEGEEIIDIPQQHLCAKSSSGELWHCCSAGYFVKETDHQVKPIDHMRHAIQHITKKVEERLDDLSPPTVPALYGQGDLLESWPSFADASEYGCPDSIFKHIHTCATDSEIKPLHVLVDKYRNVFMPDPVQPTTDLFEHSINTGDCLPIMQRPQSYLKGAESSISSNCRYAREKGYHP